MNAMSFFEKISGLQRKREEQNDQQYSDIVASLVAGTESEPMEVERILSEAGKSVEELKADVEKGQERLAMHAMVKSLPKLQNERKQILKDIDKLDAEFEKLEDQHDESRRPLVNQLNQFDDAIRDAEKAKSQLIQTCEDPGLLGEMEHVESELERLREVNRDLLSKAAYFENKFDVEWNIADMETGAEKSERLANAKEYSEEAKAVRKRMKANDKLSAELRLQRSDIEERMRKS